MGNSLFANCCRQFTDLLFQPRSSGSPDERSPLLPKSPTSCAIFPEMPETAQCAGLYPDIIPSEVVTGSLQKDTEYIQDPSETKDKEGMVTVCDKSGLIPGVGTAGLLQHTEASRAVTVLPADLGDRPAGLVDHAQSLEACQSCVKLEDGGLSHRSCRREEHVAAADGSEGPGARSAGQGHGEGRAAARLDAAIAAPDSVLKCRGPALSPGSPGTLSSALPSRVGKTLPAQNAVVLPVSPGEVSPKAQDTSAGFVTEPTACPSRKSSCDPDSQTQVLPSKQQQQQKKRKKKKLPLPGAQSQGLCPAAWSHHTYGPHGHGWLCVPVGWGSTKERGGEQRGCFNFRGETKMASYPTWVCTTEGPVCALSLSAKQMVFCFCFELPFSEFIRQIPLLFVTANLVLGKDRSGSAWPSLQQLRLECTAVRDQHREPLVSFSCMQVEDRPELQGWSSSISCAEDGMFLVFFTRCIIAVQWGWLAPQNSTGADNRKCIPKVGAGKGRGFNF